MKNYILLLFCVLLLYACNKQRNKQTNTGSVFINNTLYSKLNAEAKRDTYDPNKIDLTLSIDVDGSTWYINVYRIDPNKQNQEAYSAQIISGSQYYSRFYQNEDSCLADMNIQNGDVGLDHYDVEDSVAYNVLTIESFNNGVLKGNFNLHLFREDHVYAPVKGLADTLHITQGKFETVIK